MHLSNVILDKNYLAIELKKHVYQNCPFVISHIALTNKNNDNDDSMRLRVHLHGEKIFVWYRLMLLTNLISKNWMSIGQSMLLISNRIRLLTTLFRKIDFTDFDISKTASWTFRICRLDVVNLGEHVPRDSYTLKCGCYQCFFNVCWSQDMKKSLFLDYNS